MIRFIQPSFWFDRYPWPFEPIAFWVALAVLILVLLFGIFTVWRRQRLMDKINQKIWQKFGNLFFSFSVVGLILLFFKQQRLPYLGMRAWLGLWILICLAWLVFIIKFIIKEIPQIKEAKKQRAEIRKYLP